MSTHCTIVISTGEILAVLSFVVECGIEAIRNGVLIGRQWTGTLGVVEEQRFRYDVSVVVLRAV